jgi:GTP-binding protein LepA
MFPPDRIRNFCIIAHIDHGKSTLADRFLEITHTYSKREMKHAQMLDTMELEQERGITIKLQPVRMEWKGYQLNLIDTPGHVDFQYEVSRSLAACEGAILIVDATQGIEAQTLSNTYLAIEHNLTIIPVINKIDLPAADIPKVQKEMKDILGIDEKDIICISAKEGTNVSMILDRIIEQVPAPIALSSEETKALIFDSVYDNYKGVMVYVKVVQGNIKKNDTVYFLHTKQKVEVLEVGFFSPKYKTCDSLSAGEIGYVVTGLKTVRDAKVGDTIYGGKNMLTAQPLPGYKKITPFVFASLFPIEGDDYANLRDALEKLSLNDSSLSFEPDNSPALGHGFRCGFLGLLHMEIVQERLEREYGLHLIMTAPSVSYKIILSTGEEKVISNPSELPDPSSYEKILEPYTRIEILTPPKCIGGIMELAKEKRGLYQSTSYLEEDRVMLVYDIPLAEVIIDFFDSLKNISSGYASMSYEMLDYRADDLVKLDILVAGEMVEALSSIVHKSKAIQRGMELTKRLKELLPKAQFPIALQAAIGSRVIARETIPALRKDVTAKLYGGDVSRKMKLLKKQKEGKKRMKQIGKVHISQEAFLAILKR